MQKERRSFGSAQKTVQQHPLERVAESVSFVELKKLARDHLKPDSTLRKMILAEPDVSSLRRDQRIELAIHYKKMFEAERREE